jgi:hypothetical protein
MEETLNKTNVNGASDASKSKTKENSASNIQLKEASEWTDIFKVYKFILIIKLSNKVLH